VAPLRFAKKLILPLRGHIIKRSWFISNQQFWLAQIAMAIIRAAYA
jgi:hypothetical protein